MAPDMRGYGRTARPEAIDQYTFLHMVGDMVGLVREGAMSAAAKEKKPRTRRVSSKRRKGSPA